MLAIEQQPRAIEPRWHISASRAVGLVMAVVAAVLLGLAGLGMDADTLHIHTQTPNTGVPTPAPAGGDYGAHAGFSIEVLHKPEGCAEAQRVENGQTIAVKYRANLENGEVFAEQLEDPYEFVVGAGQVIAGWEKGVQKMCVGEKRKVRVPPQLGFGDQASGPVPAGATIVFEFELANIGRTLHASPDGLEMNHAEREYHFFHNADADGNGKLSEAEFARYWKMFGIHGSFAEVLEHHPDANGDGELSWDEYFVSETRHEELRRRRRLEVRRA